MRFFKKKDEPRPETVERVKEIAREPLHVHDSAVDDGLETYPIKTKEEIEEEKWEQRRWELTRYLVAQDRRSVVLGKLQASPKTIARKARELADATITELRTNKNNDYGRETDNKSI